jgi:hypothetical protein
MLCAPFLTPPHPPFPGQALGIAIDIGPSSINTCLEEAGIAFMYSPRYHPAMKAVRPVRSALKVRLPAFFFSRQERITELGCLPAYCLLCPAAVQSLAMLAAPLQTRCD